ncbi:TPA: DUF975 family protein [Streptococcus suis]|nr:DUF975 family protein [Streptococcus suis]
MMWMKEKMAEATLIREETQGMTVAFSPVVVLSICHLVGGLLAALRGFLLLRQDSSLVVERLVAHLSLALVTSSILNAITHILFGLASLQLIDFLKGQVDKLSLKGSLSLSRKEWTKPVLITLIFHYSIDFLAGLPLGIGIGHLIAGLVLHSLMILSPGAMAELALYHPSQLLQIGFIFLALGSLIYFFIHYRFSQTVFVLYDQLAEDRYHQPRAVFQESQLLMKGAYWKAFCLDLAFFVWFISECLTLNLLSFYVRPYYQISRAIFYQDLKERLSASE